MDILKRTNASNNGCPDNIRRVIDHVAQEFETKEGTKRVCELFGIDEATLDKRDFNYFLADIWTAPVQYGGRVLMCENFDKAHESIDTLMDAVAKEASSFGVSYSGYWYKTLQNTEIDINSAGRQWMYEYCTEFGFFQTPNHTFPLRSEEMNLEWWLDYCRRVFGDDFAAPADHAVNHYYGGLDIKGDNIFFLNGSEDPWQYAAMTSIKHPHTFQSTMKSILIECDSCGHCVDTHSPTEGQPEALTRAQHEVANTVAMWLKEAREEKQTFL